VASPPPSRPKSVSVPAARSATQLNESAPLGISLAFWGVEVVVRVSTSRDLDYLAHHFADYVSAGREPGRDALRVWLTSTGEHAAFVDAIRHDGGLKSIHIDRGSGPQLWERWSDRPLQPSPLPPFSLPPLVGHVKLLHASAAALPNDGGRAITIGGGSLAGKTSVLVGLLERGWRFCADDTTPVLDGQVLRYTRPMNVRAQTLDSYPVLADRIRAVGRCVVTMTGDTFMVRPRDLSLPLGNERCTRIFSVRLEVSDEWRCVRGERTLRIDHDVRRHLGRSLDCIEASIASIGQSGPDLNDA
jgi:hypothetical protein